MYTGTGLYAGKTIIGVYVKAGNNASGDCPGCGEYLTSNQSNCGGSGSTTGGGTGGTVDGDDDDDIVDNDKNNPKKVTICHVPKGNPANAHTIVVSENAAKAHIGRHGGDYYGVCNPNTGGGNGPGTSVVDINCQRTNVTATVNIESITLLLDDSSLQTFQVNAKTASVKPNAEYSAYFMRGAFVKLAGETTAPTTIKGKTVQGKYYANACFNKTKTNATTGGSNNSNQSADCNKGNSQAKNIIYRVNGKVVSALEGNIKEGNLVEVTFTISGNEPTRYSLVSYNTGKRNYSDENALDNEVFDYESEEFGPGVHTMSVTVPNNHFEVDFVKGCVIWKFGPAASNNYYDKQNRLIARANGGEKDCCKT
ncbi:hypothetical protein EON65_23175, partial [archaeon]